MKKGLKGVSCSPQVRDTFWNRDSDVMTRRPMCAVYASLLGVLAVAGVPSAEPEKLRRVIGEENPRSEAWSRSAGWRSTQQCQVSIPARVRTRHRASAWQSLFSTNRGPSRIAGGRLPTSPGVMNSISMSWDDSPGAVRRSPVRAVGDERRSDTREGHSLHWPGVPGVGQPHERNRRWQQH